MLIEKRPMIPALISKSWIRLEPDSRSSDCSKGVQASLHDPQWLLSRQWALGEFEGEDASSVIYVKIGEKHDTIKKVILGNEKINYNPEVPLEVYVEQTTLEIANTDQSGNFILDMEKRMKLGLQFKTYFYKKIIQFLDENDLKDTYRFLAGPEGFAFELNEGQKNFEPNITKEFTSILKNRVVDVYQLFDKADISTEIKDKLIRFYEVDDLDNDQTLILDAIEESVKDVMVWWKGNDDNEPFFEEPNPDISTWDPKKLEYDFQLQFGNDDKKLLCDAKDYKEDRLSWCSFTIGESDQDYELQETTEKPIVLAAKHLKIPGQPEKRFFNFEDGRINFALIEPKITNLATLLLMQFSFIHSADWYMIPFPMNIGTLSKIHSFTAVDTFGDEIEIKPAGYTQDEIELLETDLGWDSWNAFMLSKPYQDNNQRNTQYFFLPPVIADYDLGVSHEEIKFLRDETANLTWAVEKKYRTLYGEPINGYDHYFYRLNLLISNQKNDEHESILQNNSLKYTFMTMIPWNWIPFIPVHASELEVAHNKDYKHIVYRRAALLNQLLDDPTPIKPNSRLLNEVPKRYYIDESIIPKTGIIYSEQFQRTTWFNGKEFLWIGRKKRIGTGEGSSGLRFDTIPIS